MATGCRRCGGPLFRGLCLSCRPTNAVCSVCRGVGSVSGQSCRACRGRGDVPVRSEWGVFEVNAAALFRARLQALLREET
jgi:hypothetical protein